MVVQAGQEPPPPAGRVNRYSESIGGSVAQLWDNDLEGTLYTGAQWTHPTTVYLAGESTSPVARSQQLQIYRTVRFTTK
jgi:hypothetical protein